MAVLGDGHMSFLHAMMQTMPSTPALSTSLNTNGVSNFRILLTCFAGVRYLHTGAETQSTNTGTFSVSRGDWLDQGSSSDVWLVRIINSGTLDWTDSGAGRLPMTPSNVYSFGNQQTTIGTSTTNITIQLWDAASGGNMIDSVTFDIIADHQA